MYKEVRQHVQTRHPTSTGQEPCTVKHCFAKYVSEMTSEDVCCIELFLLLKKKIVQNRFKFSFNWILRNSTPRRR